MVSPSLHYVQPLASSLLFYPDDADSGVLSEGLRRSSHSSVAESSTYFFCGDSSDSAKGPLHLVQSFQLNQRARRCANLLEDSYLHAKLQNGDMITQDAKYHRNSLSKLYSSAVNKQLEGNFSDHERKL